jgi:restriction system protein
MAGIPDYQTLMLPLLQLFADGKERKFRSLHEELAIQFQLTKQEREALLPSRKQPIFVNRVSWAKTYLVKALLIEQVRRGYFTLTERGKTVLASKPENINNKFLRQFPEFVAFEVRSNRGEIEKRDTSESIASAIETPTEQMEKAFAELRSTLSKEVLERVLELTPARFERLVVELLVTMGYGGALPDAGSMTRLSGDEGIDGIIKEDKLGLDMIYLQAKRWKEGNNVGRPDIQKFVGALAGQKAQKGVFITTSAFSKEAREYAANLQQKVVLIDGEQLAELMIEYNLGVSVAQTYLIKRVDNDYFDENLD